MATTLKVRKKGILILPKGLREKAGIKEGSTVVATAVDDGIVLSPKEKDVVKELLGLAKVSQQNRANSIERVRALRHEIDEQRASRGGRAS
ncbi:MAG: AbrB/MazE/SpoVT family DNA-binding domain-containing protein [Nitrososphaerota archaeon]|nr:AbrB/MazE/SpoVT family DNA-binding domain-containing protein [Nitrososphaerota archaeon]